MRATRFLNQVAAERATWFRLYASWTMASAPRPREGSPMLFHITARSNAEEHIFRDDGDYASALTVLAQVRDVSIHMACLMPTHYHLLADAEVGVVSRTIHAINRGYAVRFNRRWKRHGHVFDSPTSCLPVTSESHFLELVRYVANNPPSPETWPWSSYPALLGHRPPFSFIDDAPIRAAFRDAAELRAYVNERAKV